MAIALAKSPIVRQDFSGEVVSDFKRRAEGVRVKHSINGNSVKLYDKAYTPKGSVLRAETTVHNGDDFRRGISDLYRRASSPTKPQHAISTLSPLSTTPPP